MRMRRPAAHVVDDAHVVGGFGEVAGRTWSKSRGFQATAVTSPSWPERRSGARPGWSTSQTYAAKSLLPERIQRPSGLKQDLT